MIVLGTSVLVDAIIPFDAKRHALASKLTGTISERGLKVYEPPLLAIELSGVLARYKPKEAVREHVGEVLAHVNTPGYGELHEAALETALATGRRAIDSFFTACAAKTGSMLVSNDKVQVQSARKACVKAFYLLKEHRELHAELQRL